MSKRLLFIHHGSIAGGAPLSMLYTMQGMRSAGYEPMAALVRPSPELHALYNDNGFLTIETPWIPIFITWSGSEGKRWNPFMWRGVFRAWSRWKEAHLKLGSLLNKYAIDAVHLNSVALSNPATLLMRIKKPFVWHVREHGPEHMGKRFRFLQKRLLKAEHVIFLSKAEQYSWMRGRDHGTVVHNFIDFEQFDASRSREKALEKLGVNPGQKIILYVGGKKKHKGVYELLHALGQVKKEWGDGFKCLMPDSAFDQTSPGKVGTRMRKLIQEYSLEDTCVLLPFNPDIVDLFAACDLLIFPATKPHFARPIIEASAMGRAVIASNLKAIDELVIDRKTGYLVNVLDQKNIASKIIELLSNDQLRESMGKAGLVFARDNFEYKKQMKKIEEIYERLFS